MIKGLARRLNEAGKIKIGKKSDTEMPTKAGGTFRPPERLDHFIITTTEKDENGDLILDQNLMENLAMDQAAIQNSKGDITGIPIRLLYDDTELNFPTRLASYEKGILTCEGDAETGYARISDFKTPKKCPCQRLDDGLCKYNGKLTCVIDAAGMFGQVHVFRTTSFNSVHGILGGIELIKTATGGKIAGLPLMLVLNNKSTTIPKTGQPTTIQVVSICYRGTMSGLQKRCLQIAHENAQFLLDMKELEENARNMLVHEVVSGDEEQDFQEEFYPDSVMNAEVEEAAQETPAEVVTGGIAMLVEVANEPEPDPAPEPSEEKAEPEAFNTRELLSAEDKAIAQESIQKTEKEMVQLSLYNRAVNSYDKVEAEKLIKRLDKAFLIKFIETVGNSDDLPEPTALKPAFVDAACRIINSDDWVKTVAAFKADVQDAEEQPEEPADAPTPTTESKYTDPVLVELSKITDQTELVAAMRKHFPGVVINGTLPVSELLEKAKSLLIATAGTKESTEEVKDNTPAPSAEKAPASPFEWDNGEPIKQATLHVIASLKNKLKITERAEWYNRVSHYFNKNNEPQALAAHMTEKQARHFAAELQNEFDSVPF